MTLTTRAATTRSASTTENTVQRNGITARDRVLIAAAQAKAANLAKLAETEKSGRTMPIPGEASGYDPITGDFLITTPDGGTIRAQNLSTGAPTGTVPVQRFASSQRASFNAPPSQGDTGALLKEMESLQRDVVALGAVQLADRDPVDVADARYSGDKWQNSTTGELFVWHGDSEEWVSTGGSAILYGIGDPVVNEVPVQLGKFYLDQQLGRLYASMPSLTIGSSLAYWGTTGPYTFDATTLAVADAFYSGDIYQGPTDHGIEDAEGGMFYRLNQAGAWVPQFTCCPELPEPPASSCGIGPYEIEIVWDPTGPGPAIGIWYTIVRVPCS